VEWLFIIIGVLVFLLLTCLLLAVPLVRRHSLNEVHSPSEFDLAYEEVAFTTEDNIPLCGYWIACQDSDRAVIILHGFSGSLDPDMRYVPHLHKAGFNVLMFDFRAHGRSGGRVTSLGALETRDVRAAVKWVLDKGRDRVGLLGFSMGGRAALLAAPSIPGVNAILSDGAPPRLVNSVTQNLVLRNRSHAFSWLLARMMLLGASILTTTNLFRTDPLFAAKHLTAIPVLFFHGEKDRYATMPEMRRMVEDAGPRAQLWSVPEARHRDIEKTRPEEYLQKMISFFSENL